LEKLDQPGSIRAELIPCRPKLLLAVSAVLACALRVDLAHGDDGIDARGPMPVSAAPVLNPDRADLELEAIVTFENEAVVVLGLGVNDFAEV
jgi:hypothetical protein